jgi:hypothetical protein
MQTMERGINRPGRHREVRGCRRRDGRPGRAGRLAADHRGARRVDADPRSVGDCRRLDGHLAGVGHAASVHTG